jgi:hypothetical protein
MNPSGAIPRMPGQVSWNCPTSGWAIGPGA